MRDLTQIFDEVQTIRRPVEVYLSIPEGTDRIINTPSGEVVDILDLTPPQFERLLYVDSQRW